MSHGVQARRMSGAQEVVGSGYNPVAEEYARRLADELNDKPLDRALLAVFAEGVRGKGRVLDIGCGPGHVASYLRRVHGIPADGLDLSPAMIAVARRREPDALFTVGDLRNLQDRGLAGIIAFYAICNIPPDDLLRAADSLAIAIGHGGLLLVAFHYNDSGPKFEHVDDLWGINVSLDFWFHTPERVAEALTKAGLEVEATLKRRPYATEYASQRAYLLARRP